MTTLREAAQQALEALEKWQYGKDPRGADDYITALKAALAEPVQEPTGWFGYDKSIGTWFETNEGDDDSVPLYTAPPQRKPLSGVEIQQIELRLRKYHDYDKYDLSLHDFARAIERAHGIGGSNESA